MNDLAEQMHTNTHKSDNTHNCGSPNFFFLNMESYPIFHHPFNSTHVVRTYFANNTSQIRGVRFLTKLCISLITSWAMFSDFSLMSKFVNSSVWYMKDTSDEHILSILLGFSYLIFLQSLRHLSLFYVKTIASCLKCTKH